MDRLINANMFASSCVQTCSYGKGDTVPIDQSPIILQSIDPATGRPMSDITALLRAQNKLDAERILNGMQEFPLDFLPADVKDSDALKYYYPRSAQLPSEMADLCEMYTERQLKEKEEKEAAELKALADKDYQDYLDSLKNKVKNNESDNKAV